MLLTMNITQLNRENEHVTRSRGLSCIEIEFIETMYPLQCAVQIRSYTHMRFPALGCLDFKMEYELNWILCACFFDLFYYALYFSDYLR